MGVEFEDTAMVLNVVRIWIIVSALLVASGWILSALHELDSAGYLIVFVIAAIMAMWQWRHFKMPSSPRFGRSWHKTVNRFKRPGPLLFLALALLSCLGGALYHSNNGDSNAYRIPRVLHWLGQEQWHWIRTLDPRINIVGSNFEWLCAPLILFTGTVKWIFLINAGSYLMLPGLIFSVFTRLQVSPRTAWWWMWLLPSGWCFILQAGSDVNDSYAAIYALAMVDFALRGCERKKAGDLWLSMVAAALVTGVKQNNIPLGLLWLAAAFPGARLLLARPIASALVVSISLLCSAIPQTVMNIKYTGSWQGLPSGTAASVWNGGSMPWKVIGNLFSIPLQNLVPPFFPPGDAWNRVMQRFVQTPLGSHFAAFERFGYLSSGVSEAQAGIGLGICLLIVVSLAGAHRLNPAVPDGAKPQAVQFLRWLRLIPWILLLIFMAEICSFEGGRLLSAYYLLLFPLLLTGPGHARLVRERLWQGLGVLVMLVAASMLVVSRNRPLFPEQFIAKELEAKYSGAKIVRGIEAAYGAPRELIIAQNHFRNDFPSDERIIGYATTNGALEPGLWQPLGERRVERILPEDTPEELRERGIHYVLVEDIVLESSGMTIEQWMKRYHGKLADQLAFLQERHRPPTHLYLVVLSPSPLGSPTGS